MPSVTTLWKTQIATLITGTYDGSCMITLSEEEYPVPANYASKSMLVPGDSLKLAIQSDGTMIYKLIKAAPRTHLMGIIHKKNNKYMALGSNNKNYNLNTAAVTFFRAQVGDEVCLIINPESEHMHAALECILK